MYIYVYYWIYYAHNNNTYYYLVSCDNMYNFIFIFVIIYKPIPLYPASAGDGNFCVVLTLKKKNIILFLWWWRRLQAMKTLRLISLSIFCFCLI